MHAAGLLTLTAQGEALGVTHSTVQRVLTGETSPSNTMIAKVLILLGVPFEALFEVIGAIPDDATDSAEVA